MYQGGINYIAYLSYIGGAAFAFYFTYVQPLSIGSTILTFVVSGLVYGTLMYITKQVKSAESTKSVEETRLDV